MQSAVAAIVCPRCHAGYPKGQPRCSVCGTLRPVAYRKSAATILLQATLIPLGMVILGAMALLSVLYVRLVRSDVYKNSLEIAFTSPEVRNALGSNLHAKFPVGHIENFGAVSFLEQAADGPRGRFAEWVVGVAGDRGHGHLYGVANEINDAWEYSRLVFKSDDGKLTVDLTPLHLLSLPAVPEKTVYLVPVGLDPHESLDWAPAYYKAKFGIRVTVLPAVPIAISLINPTRNQLDSDKCVDLFLPAKYPELVRDPSTILVAVTSQDMYIPSLGWRYAENMRSEGRFAVVSSARLHAFPLLEGLNPEWLNSRLQKLLNKNIAMLYFGLPMSSDYSSLVSGGVLSGGEIDQMTGNVIGAERHWDPFADSGGPAVTIYDARGKPQMWNRGSMVRALPDTGAQVFSMSLTNGLMIDYKADFLFPNDPAMNFTRVYRNLDDRSRAFGIGGSHNFDMSLGGQMGVAVDLVTDDGTRIHFVHQTPVAGQRGDTYRPQPGTGGQYVEAVFSAFNWTVTTTDGWTYQFPYRPKALPQYVTVLTGFTNPTHQEYTMVRDDAGALLEIENPSGEWLKFENDSDHRIRKIKASTGRTLEYEYDANGGMIRATDSDGHTDSYTYDSKGEMLTASHGDGSPTLANEYFGDGEIKNQTLADGKSFQYSYFHDEQAMNETQITDPNGLEIHVEHQGGYYREWLPVPPPH